MYAMTYISPMENHWIKEAGLTGKPWHALYFYAFYWAVTTMVTVGYGDLLPQN